MTESRLKIEGMSCMHCAVRVEKALKSLQGVETANVNLEKNEAHIEFDPTKTNIEKFRDTIEEAGYKVKA